MQRYQYYKFNLRQIFVRLNNDNLPFVPGFPPNTKISPEFSLRLPTIHDKSVVFPQPEAPKRPYLELLKRKIKFFTLAID